MSIFSSKERETSTQPTYVPPPKPASPVQHTPAASAGLNISNNSTIISEGAILDGHIKIEGDIRVEGLVKGTVTSKGKVLISNSGKIDGDIICQQADIAGHVTGKLKVADILYLKGNAVIDGDINTGKLVMESGVKFNGNCTMGSPVQASVPKPAESLVKPPANSVNLDVNK